MREPAAASPFHPTSSSFSIHAFSCAIRFLLGEKRSRSWNYGLWSDHVNVKATENHDDDVFCLNKNHPSPSPASPSPFIIDQSHRTCTCMEEAETSTAWFSNESNNNNNKKLEMVSVIVEFLLNAERFETEKLLGELTTNCNAHDCDDHVCDGVVCGVVRCTNTMEEDDDFTDEIDCAGKEAKEKSASSEQCCWSTFLRKVQETSFFSGVQAQLDEVRGAPATTHAPNRSAVNENGGRRSRVPRNKLAPLYIIGSNNGLTSASSALPLGGFTTVPTPAAPMLPSAVLLNPLSDIFFISPLLASIFPGLTNCFFLNEAARDHHHHEGSMMDDATEENAGSGEILFGEEGNGWARSKQSSRFEKTKKCGYKFHGYSFLFDTRVADDLKKIFVENGVIMMECILSHGYDPFHFISNAPQLFIKKFGLAGLRLLFAHGLDPEYTTAKKLEEFGLVDGGKDDQQKKKAAATNLPSDHQNSLNEKGEGKEEYPHTLLGTSPRLFDNSFLSLPLLSSAQSHSSGTGENRTIAIRNAARQYIICSVLFSSYYREQNHFGVLLRSAAEAGCAPNIPIPMHAADACAATCYPSAHPSSTTAYPFSTIHYTNDLPPPTATLLHASADLCVSEPFSKFAAGALPNGRLRLPLPPALGGNEGNTLLSSSVVSSLNNNEENDFAFISSSACASSSASPYISEKDPLASLLLILGEGADPDNKDSFLRTPIHLAKSSEAVFALFASGAAINADDFLGNNAFHLVVSKNNRLCLSCALATCGCDLGAINIRGWTPFMEAVLKCSAPDLALTVRSEEIIKLWRRVRLSPRQMRFLAPYFSRILEILHRLHHSLPTSDMNENEGPRLGLGYSTLKKQQQHQEKAERKRLTPIKGEPKKTPASTLSIEPLADHNNNFTIAHTLVLRLINNGDSGNVVISSFLRKCLTPPSTTSNISSKVSSPSSSSSASYCFSLASASSSSMSLSSPSCTFPNSNTLSSLSSLTFTLSSSDSIALQTELTTNDVRIDLDDGTHHPFRVRRELQKRTKTTTTTTTGRNGISLAAAQGHNANASVNSNTTFTLVLRKKSSPLHLAALINAIDAIKPIVTAIAATTTKTKTSVTPAAGDRDDDDNEESARDGTPHGMTKGKEEKESHLLNSIQTVLGLVDEDGRTCLHVAAERDHDAFIHHLLTESYNALSSLSYICGDTGLAREGNYSGKCVSGGNTSTAATHPTFVSSSMGASKHIVITPAAITSSAASEEAHDNVVCRGFNGLSSSSSSSSSAFSCSSRSSPPDLANNKDNDGSHTGSDGNSNFVQERQKQQQQQHSHRRRIAHPSFIPRCAANAHLYDSSSSSSSSDDDNDERRMGTRRTEAKAVTTTVHAKIVQGGERAAPAAPKANLMRKGGLLRRGVVSLSSSSDSDDLSDSPLSLSSGNRLLFSSPTSTLSSPLCANAPAFVSSSNDLRAMGHVKNIGGDFSTGGAKKDHENEVTNAAEVAMEKSKARLLLLRVVEARDANGETAADIATRGLAQLVDEYNLAVEALIGWTNRGRLDSTFSSFALSLDSSSSSSSEDTTDEEAVKEKEKEEENFCRVDGKMEKGKQRWTTAAQPTSTCMMRRRWMEKLQRAFADRALTYLRILCTLRAFTKENIKQEIVGTLATRREGSCGGVAATCATSGTHTAGNDHRGLTHIIASATEKVIEMKAKENKLSLLSRRSGVLRPHVDGTSLITRSDALVFLEEVRRSLRMSNDNNLERGTTATASHALSSDANRTTATQLQQQQQQSDTSSESTTTANLVINAYKRSRSEAEDERLLPSPPPFVSSSSPSAVCHRRNIASCAAYKSNEREGHEGAASRIKRHFSER